MSQTTAIDLLLRLFHIIPALILVGGTCYQCWIEWPFFSGTRSPGHTGESSREGARARWARIVMLSTALLLFTGLTNFVLMVKRYEFVGTPGAIYHLLGLVKILLALGIFALCALLSGRTPAARQLQQQGGKWLWITVSLMLLLVIVASMMRVSERQPKTGPLSIVDCRHSVQPSDHTGAVHHG